jgi:hypothetical protein
MRLRAFDGTDYILFESTWDLKLKHEERAHVEHNFHKIVETLASPEEVRESLHAHSACFIAYKQFERYYVRENITAPNPPWLKWFAIVANQQNKVIKTFYPCRNIKAGKKIWPPT